MKKIQKLTLLLVAAGTFGSVDAAPVITTSSVRDIRNDAFSPTSSITILGSSTVANGSALNLFGGMGGVEGDDAIFVDAPIGTTYFVNWKTAAPVLLGSIRVALSDDSPTNNRAISQLRVFPAPMQALPISRSYRARPFQVRTAPLTVDRMLPFSISSRR